MKHTYAVRKGFWVLALLVIFSFLQFSPAHAEVAVKEGFTASFVLELPNGEMETVDAGEAVPAIASGSVMDVFDGNLTLSTGKGDSVELGCLQHYITVAEGASVSVECLEKGGKVKVLAGQVHLVKPDNQETDLKEGTEYSIEVKEEDLAEELVDEPADDEPAGDDMAVGNAGEQEMAVGTDQGDVQENMAETPDDVVSADNEPARENMEDNPVEENPAEGNPASAPMDNELPAASPEPAAS
jgi:hypothetical protein